MFKLSIQFSQYFKLGFCNIRSAWGKKNVFGRQRQHSRTVSGPAGVDPEGGLVVGPYLILGHFFLVKLGCKLEKQIPYLGLIGLILCERVRTKQEGQRRHQFQEIASPPPRFHSTVVFCLQARLYCYFCSYLVGIFWVISRGGGNP